MYCGPLFDFHCEGRIRAPQNGILMQSDRVESARTLLIFILRSRQRLSHRSGNIEACITGNTIYTYEIQVHIHVYAYTCAQIYTHEYIHIHIYIYIQMHISLLETNQNSINHPTSMFQLFANYLCL